jgi:Glutathione S-transferase, N-terminal domain
MLKFYFNASPNPAKVALFLEEAGLPYEAIPIDTRMGEQFSAEFAALNPNAKVPVIVDSDVTVFDSTAILLYLSEKTGQGSDPTPARRYISDITRRRTSNTPAIGINTRRAGTTPFWMPGWFPGRSCWERGTPSWTWQRGAGRE